MDLLPTEQHARAKRKKKTKRQIVKTYRVRESNLDQYITQDLLATKDTCLISGRLATFAAAAAAAAAAAVVAAEDEEEAVVVKYV